MDVSKTIKKPDLNYRGALEGITCPISGECIKFSFVNFQMLPYQFNYIVENTTIRYISIGYGEDSRTIFTSNTIYNKYFRNFILKNTELVPVIITRYNVVENPSSIDIIKFKCIDNLSLFMSTIKHLFTKSTKVKLHEISSSQSKILNIKQMSKQIDISNHLGTYDIPEINSIRKGDTLKLTNKSSLLVNNESITVIVRNLHSSILVDLQGNIYDMSEWSWLRILK